MKNRELKRQLTVARYAKKHVGLRAIIVNPDPFVEGCWNAQAASQRQPHGTSASYLCNRCRLTGRPHGLYCKFSLNHNKLCEATMRGDVSGLVKASQ